LSPDLHRSVCSGWVLSSSIQRAHPKGTTSREIKPRNVFGVRPGSPQPLIKLAGSIGRFMHFYVADEVVMS
jgi:hypothetical protein